MLGSEEVSETHPLPTFWMVGCDPSLKAKTVCHDVAGNPGSTVDVSAGQRSGATDPRTAIGIFANRTGGGCNGEDWWEITHV